jgi:hypothetical protein
VKADTGPAGVDASPSAGDGADAGTLGDGEGALVIGGGSMDECDVGGFEGITGSGKDGISSSILDVSMVMCLVAGVV